MSQYCNKSLQRPSWYIQGSILALVVWLTPQVAVGQILGANFNGRPRNIETELFPPSNTTWVRGFYDILAMQNVSSLEAHVDVLGLRRAADAGQQLMVSFKWDFAGHNQRVPAPGSPAEQGLFDRAVETLEAIGRPINTIVLGNEPMWETPEVDLAFVNGSVPYVIFTERLLAHVQQAYGDLQTQPPDYFLGSLNRLDRPVNQSKDVVQELFRVARDSPAVAGMDIHIHFSTEAQAYDMAEYARQQLGPTKDLLVTEFSPVWRYKDHLDDAIGATSAGQAFAQQYGYSANLKVDDYLTTLFANQVTRQEWTDFIVSQPWFNENHLNDMQAIFREFDVSIATLGFAQTLGLRGLDVTQEGYNPYPLNWLYIAGMVEGDLVEAYNEPYMEDWLASQYALADFDRDGQVNLADYDLLAAALSTNYEATSNVEALMLGDMNLDRAIDDVDLALFDIAFTAVNPDAFGSSDFNGDGDLDAFDLLIFKQNWLALNSDSNVGAFRRGDRNRDGVNDLADWLLIRQDFMKSGRGSAFDSFFNHSPAPEPGTWFSLVSAMFYVLLGRPHSLGRQWRR